MAAPTILSLSYAASNPNITIGTNITINMVVLDVTTQLSPVTAGSPAVGSLILTAPSLASQGAGNVYITEGTRTWRVFYGGGGGTTLQIDNGNLLSAGTVPTWLVSDYSALQSQVFRMYLGNPINGTTAGPPSVTADLGTFGNVVLNDSGNPGDANLLDEIWGGLYSVPDLGTAVTGSRVYGHYFNAGVLATNDGFQSPQTLAIDAIRPAVNSVNFTVPSRPNYNNVLYLSALSQGNTTAQPTNSIGRFDVAVNKVGTVVNIRIGTAAPKELPPIVVPPGSQVLTAWTTWKGDDGNGNFAPDGIYPVSVYIKDLGGVTGLTHTSEVRVTSLRYEITNIRLLPSGRTVEPVFSAGVITGVRAEIVAYRDNNQSLRESLFTLGWPRFLGPSPDPYAPLIPTEFSGPHALGGVYGVQEVEFLDQSGDVSFGISPEAGKDAEPSFDNDEDFVDRYSADPIEGTGFVNGDADKTNDWTSVVFEELQRVTYTVDTTLDPVRLVANYGVNIIGASPPQGNYRVRLRSKLSGLNFGRADNGGWHFYPSALPEGSSNASGLGIFAEEASFIFQVTELPPPISDNTPPVFLGSSPIEGSIVSPTTYGPSSLLTVQFQDTDSSMNTSGSVSFISVTDPQGGSVGGSPTNDGGGPNNTLTLNFRPFANLNKGGTYTLTANTCNNAGLCVSRQIPFTVLDQTAPSVSAVELVHSSGGGNESLSISQTGPEGPFEDISEVWVTLSMPATSTNTIRWDLSSVTIYEITGTGRVPLDALRLTSGTPTDGRLRYRLSNVINSAGLFEVDTLTASQDSSNQTFNGPPAGAIKPRFTTQVCVSCVTVLYAAPGTDNARPAITGFSSLTLASGVTPLSPASIGVDAPAASALPADPGWTQLSSSLFAHSMRFFVSGVLQTTPLTWTFLGNQPVIFAMYYNDVDLPTPGVVETDLVVRGYANGSWSTVANVQHDSLPVSSNAFRFSPTSSQPAAVYYAIKYPNTAGGGVAPAATATPLSHTRAFNPVSSNPVGRRARFYSGQSAPTRMEARIYDTAGRLIRSFALGRGIDPALFQVDANGVSNYYFEWDGTNDSGNLVRNGIYLVRWNVTRADGSSSTVTKPVALIK